MYGILRDLKPSNLFLRDCQFDRTTVLDFGIARLAAATELLTEVGSALGTPGYMAPEQARGEREIGPSADVFSLGCVLFQCLTGRPPFIATHAVAVLAKILCEEAPRLRTLRADVPQAIEELLQRLLAKEPAQRPTDAGALLAELERIEADLLQGTAMVATVEDVTHRSPLSMEQRLICVLILEPGHPVRPAPEPADGLPTAPLMEAPGPAVPADAGSAQKVKEVLAEFGGRGDWLMSGELVVTFCEGNDASDLVGQTARCALALARFFPGAGIVLTTGRGRTDAGLPIGEAIDRAALRDRRGPARPCPAWRADRGRGPSGAWTADCMRGT